jgi:hypothetical protein
MRNLRARSGPTRKRHRVAAVVAVVTLVAAATGAILFSISPTHAEVAPTPAPAPRAAAIPAAIPAPTWRDHLGVVTTIDRHDLETAAHLGVGWVRIDWKQGWGADDNWKRKAAFVDRAHELGLKVMQTCQRSDRDYTSPGNVESFAGWCAGWVGVGVDAIEIGNEWNGGYFFPTNDARRAADVTEAVAHAIRARSTTITIVTNGWAPMQSPAALEPADATRTMFERQPDLQWQANAVAWHPYLTVGPPGYGISDQDPVVDPFLNREVREMAQVAPRQEQWFTEFGTPSTALNGGIPFDETIQAVQIQRSFDAIAAWHQSGIPIGVAFLYSLSDGAWSQSFGIYRPGSDGRAGRPKPAVAVVEHQATQPW